MEKLGCGSDVCVYKYVRDTTTSPWAIKRLTRNADDLIKTRLKTEANYLKQFNHANIVAFRNLELHNCPGSPSKRLSLFMELCDTSLEKIITTRIQTNPNEPFLASRILTVALHVSRALQYIHDEHHLLHGDLKSANVLVSGDFEEVKLCDFGVCVKLLSNNRGQADPENEVYQGTEQWWPKETIGDNNNPKDITDRTDIYPFGLVLWEMLTLEVPHERWVKNKDDENFDAEDEPEYKAALGTCPPVPELKKNYSPVIELIVCCCNEEWKKRPRAKRIVKVLEDLMDHD